MLDTHKIRGKKLKMIVPTDFSGSGINAAAYAIELFHTKTGELVLENAYEVPKEKSGTLVSIGDILANESKLLLEKERKYLTAEFKDVNVTIDSEEGSIINIIKNAIKSTDIHLLVLGISNKDTYLTGVPKTFIELPHFWPVLTVPKTALKDKSNELVIIISEDSKHKNAIALEKYLKGLNLSNNKAHHLEYTKAGVERLKKQIEQLLKKHKIGLIVFNTSKGDLLQKAIMNHDFDNIFLTLPALLTQNGD